MAEQDFEGKVVLITGGGSGIGATTARGFSARGARVVLADRDAAEPGVGRSRRAGLSPASAGTRRSSALRRE